MKHRIISPSELAYLFLDLNSFFAHVEQQLNPALRGRPVGVVPTETDYTCLIAASYEAKAYGLKTGTMVKEAKGTCPDIQLVQADHQKYVRFHHAILEEIHRHTPVSQVCSIDEVACRLFKNDRSPLTAKALALDIKQGISRSVGPCLTSSIGIAPNRFLAKLASNMQKPDGLVILEPQDLPGAIQALPVHVLTGIGRGMESRLLGAGIRSVGDLWSLSKSDCRQLWGGINGERFWYDLHGYQVPEQATERRSISHSQVLSPEHRPIPQARLIARRLLMKAASRLRRSGYLSSSFTLGIRLERGSSYYQDQRLEATDNSFHLLEALEGLWRDFQVNYPLERWRVKKVGVILGGLMLKADSPRNLFQVMSPEDRSVRQQTLSESLDQLNDRFGREAVTIGWLPSKNKKDTGTKVAFHRVPELWEFGPASEP